MKRILVIGIGSRIMMDDAIGIYLVEDLIRKGVHPEVTYVIGETDVDYCIEEVLDYDCIIVIDAYLSGKQAGEITVIPLLELDNEKEALSYSTHGLHLLSQLRNKKHVPKVNLIGIEPYEINYGFSLSDPLQKQYQLILTRVTNQIHKYTMQYGGRKNA
jgi:hydrogenase maturation protease